MIKSPSKVGLLDHDENNLPYSYPAVAAIFFFPALGGLLFGYDIGATAYVVPQLMTHKHSGVRWHNLVEDNVFLQGAITSAGVGGALIGSIVVFRFTDRLGTRREMLLAALLFAAGASVEFVSGQPDWSAGTGIATLLLGRWVYGLACGFAMHGAPSYIAELSPPAIRGALVSLKEGMIVLGMLFGYVCGYCLSNVSGGWRFTYAFAVLPAVAMFLGVTRLPSPPRWLVGKERQASEGRIAAAAATGGRSISRRASSNPAFAKALGSLRFIHPTLGDAMLRRLLADVCNGGGGSGDDAQRSSSSAYSSGTAAFSDSHEGGVTSPLVLDDHEAGTYAAPGLDRKQAVGGGGGENDDGNSNSSGGGGSGDVQSEASLTRASANGGEVTMGSIFTAENKPALLAGLGIVTLQQVTGQPSILYYASSIFDEAGMAAYAAVLTGGFKLLMTLFSVVVVDRFGRRWLLFVGVTVMLVALTVMVVAFWGHSSDDDDDNDGNDVDPSMVFIILGMFLYIGGYQVSFGPVAWLLISEIFPLDVRDQAISVAVFTNFAWNLVVSFLYPVIVDLFGTLFGDDYKLSAAFLIFLFLTLYSLHFVNRYVPETKGLTLQQIQSFLRPAT